MSKDRDRGRRPDNDNAQLSLSSRRWCALLGATDGRLLERQGFKADLPSLITDHAERERTRTAIAGARDGDIAALLGAMCAGERTEEDACRLEGYLLGRQLPHDRRLYRRFKQDGSSFEKAIADDPNLHRPDLDMVWDHVLHAEQVGVARGLSQPDRDLAQTGWRHAMRILYWTWRLEAGHGDAVITSQAGRPFRGSLRQWLGRLLENIDRNALADLHTVAQNEEIERARDMAHLIFAKAKKIRNATRRKWAAAWSEHEREIERKIGAACVSALAHHFKFQPFNPKQGAKLVTTVLGRMAPRTAAIQLVAAMYSVPAHVVSSYAKTRIVRLAGVPDATAVNPRADVIASVAFADLQCELAGRLEEIRAGRRRPSTRRNRPT